MTMNAETYRQRQAELATKAEEMCLGIAAASVLSGFTLAQSMGTFLASVNLSATALADVFTAYRLGLSPLGLSTPGNEPDRLAAVFAGVLEDQRANPLPRIGRIARSEPVNAAHRATQTALKRHDVPARLKWILDPDPCPFCIDLASRTYPVDELPKSHPNCECTVIAITQRQEAAA